MLSKALLSLAFLFAFSVPSTGQSSRHFTFRYAFTVKNVPAGEKVRLWIPAAHSDSFQEVRVLSATGNLRLKKAHESKYGNEMYYGETSRANQPELHFEVTYDVVRHERLTLGVATPHLEDLKLNDKERKQDLSPDRLVPTTGLPADLAASATAGKAKIVDKARAIYDYVFDNMKYDKTGTGWGQGDVLYACNAKKGNCTDFHSLFMAMARSQGIPVRFEIGFPLPEGKHTSEIAGYHCWSDFFDPEHGMGPSGHFRSMEEPRQKGLFLWRPRRQPCAVHNRTGFGAEPETGGSAAELFRLSLCGSGRQTVR